MRKLFILLISIHILYIDLNSFEANFELPVSPWTQSYIIIIWFLF